MAQSARTIDFTRKRLGETRDCEYIVKCPICGKRALYQPSPDRATFVHGANTHSNGIMEIWDSCVQKGR